MRRVYSVNSSSRLWRDSVRFLAKRENQGLRVLPRIPQSPIPAVHRGSTSQERQTLPRAKNGIRIVLDARGWCIRDDLGRFGSRFSRAEEFGDLDSWSPDVQQPAAWGGTGGSSGVVGALCGGSRGVPGSQAAHQNYQGHSKKYLGVLSETQQTAPDPCRWRDDGHRARFVPRFSRACARAASGAARPHVRVRGGGAPKPRFLGKRVFPRVAKI